jgi:lipoate-protein ligase A
MALEEYILESKDFTEDYFFFYIHAPSIIVGRFQNTVEEINADYVRDNHIYVARRVSGGGAVYHDQGNLNFSFIVNAKGHGGGFETYTRPVIRAIRALGAEATLSGRNDILVDGKKISGNAQCMRGGKLLQHGTILFDSNIDHLVTALSVNDLKIISKGIKSVRSRVTNLKEHLPEGVTINMLKARILDEIDAEYGIKTYTLTDEDIEAVSRLAAEKFATREWNYGCSPAYSFINKKKYDFGLVEARLDIKQGTIRDMALYGDFFAKGELQDFISLFIGVSYDRDSLRKILDANHPGAYITGMEIEDFMELVYVEQPIG